MPYRTTETVQPEATRRNLRLRSVQIAIQISPIHMTQPYPIPPKASYSLPKQ